MKKPTQIVKVVAAKDQELPALEILASHIEAISKVGKAIQESRLKKRAVLVLLADITHLPMRTIEQVLDALPQLKAHYLK